MSSISILAYTLERVLSMILDQLKYFGTKIMYLIFFGSFLNGMNGMNGSLVTLICGHIRTYVVYIKLIGSVVTGFFLVLTYPFIYL